VIWIRALANGALELILAAFFLTATFIANDGARIDEPHLVVIDVLAAAAVALTGWRPQWGAAMGIAVALAGLAFDADQFGLWPMTLMCVVVSLMRLGRWPLAAVSFSVIFASSVAATYRASITEEDVLWQALFTWGTLDAFMLIVGLGLYAASRHAADLAEQESKAVRLQAAIDLHDLVAKDLTIIAMEAERAKLDGATAESLSAIADRARAAGVALRSTVGYLSSGRPDAPAVTFAGALRSGMARLERANFHGRVEGDLSPTLPASIDAAAGRILTEALFNVSQHGRRKGRWHLSAEKTDESFDFIITNERTDGPIVAGLGTVSISQSARAVGGHVDQSHTICDWTCSVSLPLTGDAS